MNIKLATMTGADDTVHPLEILKLSAKYPFAEWGILLSSAKAGQPRFPSRGWLRSLSHHVLGENPVNLSLHLCGAYVSDFVHFGFDDFVYHIGKDLWKEFDRVQLNFHGHAHVSNPSTLYKAIKRYKDKTFIFQLDKENNAMFYEMASKLPNVVGLHDLSHGTGVLPKRWPSVDDPKFRVGYAGGLGPENLGEQLLNIEFSAPFDYETWVDMETNLRSFDPDHGDTFDMTKVETCLKIVGIYNEMQRDAKEGFKSMQERRKIEQGGE